MDPFLPQVDHGLYLEKQCSRPVLSQVFLLAPSRCLRQLHMRQKYEQVLEELIAQYMLNKFRNQSLNMTSNVRNSKSIFLYSSDDKYHPSNTVISRLILLYLKPTGFYQDILILVYQDIHQHIQAELQW